jgi:ribosomal protein S14
VLFVRDWTGFLGQGSQGPVLKTFPLTRAQLRELALRPQLLP